MIALRTFVAISIGIIALPAFADGQPGEDTGQSPMQGMVKNEVLKTQADLTREIGEAQVRIKAYEAQRSDVVVRAKDQAKQDAEGMKLLKEYDHLLSTRYVTKKGDFEPGLELSAADFEALNNLARTHLYALFFTGRTSAGFARKAVKQGIKQLDDLHDAHSDPSDGNNPELEIIAKLIHDDEGRVKRAKNLLDELDLKPDANLIAQIEAAAQQADAAQQAEQQQAQPVAATQKKSKRRPAAQGQ